MPCSASLEKVLPTDQEKYRIPQPDIMLSERHCWEAPTVSSLQSSENLMEEGDKRKSIFFVFVFGDRVSL